MRSNRSVPQRLANAPPPAAPSRIARHLPRVARSQPHQPARRAHLCPAIPRRASRSNRSNHRWPCSHRGRTRTSSSYSGTSSVQPVGCLIRGVRGGSRQRGITALLPTEFLEHPRVAVTNSVCNCGRDSTRPPGPATELRTGTGTLRRVVSSGPRRMRDAHLHRRARAGRAEHSSRRRLSERRRVPQLVASNGGARPRQPVRFGDGVEQSVVAALVASGMCREGATERDRVTGIATTTIPPERG